MAMEFQQPKMELAPELRPMLNVGATLDIPTGKYLYGEHGEAILTGGAPNTIGVVGMPNAFKSAFVKYIVLMILSRFMAASGHEYDTESTSGNERWRHLASYFDRLCEQDIIDMGRWMISNRTVEKAEIWFDKLKDFMESRLKDKKIVVETPFLNRARDGFFKIIQPYLVVLDSMSEFITSSDEKMQDENKLGEKGGLTIFMKQGLNKTRFMQEMPTLAVASNVFMFITAHLGKEIPMDPNAPPSKTLQYLRQGMKIKGAPPKFEYLTHLSWIANSAPPLITKEKTPKYPRDSDDNLEGDTDLVCVTMTILRNKTGPSGLQTQLIYSQESGLLPSLTEFHYIKEHDNFGVSGGDRNYVLDLLPEVALSRSAVRGKIDTNETLRRALNITSEICQMKNHWHHLDPEWMCTPKELYDDLIKAGYDWDILLATRGWWTTKDNEEHLPPFLSSLDLLRMRKGLYRPWWYDEAAKHAAPKKTKKTKPGDMKIDAATGLVEEAA